MRRSLGTTVLGGLIFCSSGCWPADSTSGSDGGLVGFGGPTLEVTINGVHFGPAKPDAATLSLSVNKDATGTPTGASFRLDARVGTAGCTLGLDRFGPGQTIKAAQYVVQSMQGSYTLDGTVYPTTGEHFLTPEGGASCSGSDCDGHAFVLNELDDKHAAGYYRGIVSSDNGLGQAEAVCNFWLPMGVYP